MNKFILAIDQGTTGTTAVLINSKDYTFVGKVNREFPQIYPKPSWVEHNLNDIWDTVGTTVQEVLSKNNITPQQIESIGITNQRETTCAFNKKGEPLTNAIVWQDRRTAPICEKLATNKNIELIKRKTGLPIDAYFSGTKMQWFLNENDNVKNAASSNDLCFGTIDTFLLYKLTSGESFKTEVTNASRTLLMDLESRNWDDELLSLLEVRKDFLPDICDSFTQFGTTKGLPFLPDGIPITGILGDQQSALFGQACYKKGGLKCTYGTGAFALLNIGEEIKYSHSGLLTTLAYQHKGKAVYAFEGACYIAGAAVQWLRDNLGIIADSPSIERLASEVENLEEMENILFLPFFTGIASPYWKSDAKAAIIGLTRDSAKPHIARACLEGVAYSIQDLVAAFLKDAGLEIKELKVDGGMVNNDLFLQTQASVSNTQIIRPKIVETTAYGAALASAIGSGTLDIDKLENFWQKDKQFSPQEAEQQYLDKKYQQWKGIIQKLYL